MVIISILKYEGIMENILWALRLGVGRRLKPVLGYISKSTENRIHAVLKGLFRNSKFSKHIWWFLYLLNCTSDMWRNSNKKPNYSIFLLWYSILLFREIAALLWLSVRSKLYNYVRVDSIRGVIREWYLGSILVIFLLLSKPEKL